MTNAGVLEAQAFVHTSSKHITYVEHSNTGETNTAQILCSRKLEISTLLLLCCCCTLCQASLWCLVCSLLLFCIYSILAVYLHLYCHFQHSSIITSISAMQMLFAASPRVSVCKRGCQQLSCAFRAQSELHAVRESYIL